ncbi:acyltransferase family protein [Pararhizobium sp. DWP1-1-3]|uniref:acyltransferase family protein n=1 Tax=Pararhizobium sp. DWP1-1-3 TaxID=2804652 RepID=UPI003CE81A38
MRKLDSLQVLRGIAASLVVVDHSILRNAEWANYPAIVRVAAPYSGTLGVAIFFVISGFIMMHTAGDQFGKMGAPLTFLRKRIVRIVPLYWAATALEAALRLHKGGEIELRTLLTSLFFIPVPVAPGEYMRPLLGVGWTLNYEMFFYCIFAVCLLFKRQVGLLLLFSTLAGLVAIGAIYKPLSDTSAPHGVITFWTDPIILLFAAGAAVSLAAEALRGAVSSIHFFPIAAVILSIWAAVFLWIVGSYPIPMAWQLGGWAVCILSVGLCVLEEPVPRNLARGLGTQLGDISYALYLFHFFAIVAAEKIWWLLFGKGPSILFVAAAYFASVAAAYAIHHLFEVNVTRLFSSRSGRSETALLIPDIEAEATPPQPAQTLQKPAHLYGRK